MKDSVGVEIGDISVNNSVAIDNSFFVRTLALADPRLRHLGRVIKYWAMRRKINQRAEGTLSTYTIMLQVFYLLQTRGVLPSFLDLREDLPTRLDGQDVVETRPDGQKILRLRDARSINVDRIAERLSESSISRSARDSSTLSVGSLFVDFFVIFGSREFSGEDGVGKTIVDCDLRDNDEGAMVMRCPITLANVNPMTSDVWHHIHSEFARAREMVLARRPLEEILEEATESPLKVATREKTAEKKAAKKAAKMAKEAKEASEKEERLEAKKASLEHPDGSSLSTSGKTTSNEKSTANINAASEAVAAEIGQASESSGTASIPQSANA